VKTLVRIKFGSHLYGTATPASDVDFKSVFIPDARDILLQRVKGSINSQRPKAEGEKNVAGEIDEEAYSLQRFLGLAGGGQTVALDVLFAPDWAMIEPAADEWREVIANRHRLITRKSAAFLGYCRQQANKYGIKGSRVAAARAALAVLAAGLERHGTTAKLSVLAPEFDVVTREHPHMEQYAIEGQNGPIMHWDVCGRKMPYTASIKTAHDVMARLVAEYGHRALQAESQQGVDWKALSHAVRVGTQACELLRTGQVTFPSPNREHLVAIKLGQLAYAAVAEEIENLLEAVEREAEASTLRETADLAWIDAFVSEVYKQAVCR
jgi:hypothetical protein